MGENEIGLAEYLSNVVLNECDVVKERILQINPNAKVKAYSLFYNKENKDIILNERVDYVVDAIDTISCKWELIKLCLDYDIKFISSMGMGNREDLTKIDITSLDKTNYDPVAKKFYLGEDFVL